MLRKGFLILVFLLLTAVAFPFLWQQWVQARYNSTIYAIESVPPERVAIVFGARVFPDGRLSAMLYDRVETAVQLYESGKAQRLLFSGDGRFANYNEPETMMAYALRRGVPAEAIQLDYGGWRTYDTCYRARDIFALESAILVTQEFHLPRALFTCKSLGLEVAGVAADLRAYSPRSLSWLEQREIAALSLALLDVIRRAPPPVLGEPIPIN